MSLPAPRSINSIPKAFRWLSERYPLISQLIQENRIPEFGRLAIVHRL
jgi:5'-3' exonuclease